MTATVLVVDDLEPNVKLLEAKLLSEYYLVLTASNGKEALSVLEKNKVDIVLLDVMMPEMDGFEACRHIKENPDTMHIPVVMVTALSDIEDRVKGLEAGADEFLTKPIDDVALFARLRALSRMKTMIDELKLRNKTNEQLGTEIFELKDNFSESRILVIDDDVIQTKNIKASLSTITDQVKVITNPDEIDELAAFIPDLVILSCQIDIESPLRVVAHLKAKENYKNSSIMLLTEEENVPMVIKGMELGVSDYFLYPVDTSELAARVRTQLRRKHFQDDLRSDLEERVDLSTKDSLTGVFNRRYFDVHLSGLIERAQQKGSPFCLMMLDLDHFKSVNDEYGHQSGDAVLKSISEILKDVFRITDLIARYGGEEFAVLLRDVELAEGKEIAERTRKSIEDYDFTVPGKEGPLKRTTSIGIAEYNGEEDANSFIRRADKALYDAKEAGRNKVSADE